MERDRNVPLFLFLYHNAIALAALEVIVHFQPISTIPKLVVVSATIPKDLSTDIHELHTLYSLNNETETKEIGDAWGFKCVPTQGRFEISTL